jgi:hypothetical protein
MAIEELGERKTRRTRPVKWLVQALTVLAFCLSALLITATPGKSQSLKDCWDTVKSSAELQAALGEAAAKYIEDVECAKYYELPAFWGLVSALASIRAVDGPDCQDAQSDKIIAGILDKIWDELNIPLPGVKAELHKIATGESNKALNSIPGFEFFGCACKLSNADDDVRKFIEQAQKALSEGKQCLAAIGEAILKVPGLIGQGVGFLSDLLGSIPGLGDALKIAGDLVEGVACSNDVTGSVYEAFGGDCDEGPDPKDKLKDHLKKNLVELCHDANLTDAEIEAMAKQAGGSFAEKCKNERDLAKAESNKRLCEGTGGWWVGGQFAICSCPPGKAHANWCEPEPCPPPYTPPIVK